MKVGISSSLFFSNYCSFYSSGNIEFYEHVYSQPDNLNKLIVVVKIQQKVTGPFTYKTDQVQSRLRLDIPTGVAVWRLVDDSAYQGKHYLQQ